MDTRTLSAVALRDAIRRGDVSAEQAVTDALDAITSRNPELNAFITVDAERAIARARECDAASNRSGVLHGVPVAIQDTILRPRHACDGRLARARRLPAPV
jgi:amidase